jgi:hypothetical protein
MEFYWRAIITYYIWDAKRDKEARATCIEWSKLCDEGGVGQSEQSWAKWKMHLRLNGGEAV